LILDNTETTGTLQNKCLHGVVLLHKSGQDL
jgi:hypothetical protein